MSNQTPTVHDVLEEKLTDLTVPGFIAEFSPDEAALLGAFIEEALTEDDALEARHG